MVPTTTMLHSISSCTITVLNLCEREYTVRPKTRLCRVPSRAGGNFAATVELRITVRYALHPPPPFKMWLCLLLTAWLHLTASHRAANCIVYMHSCKLWLLPQAANPGEDGGLKQRLQKATTQNLNILKVIPPPTLPSLRSPHNFLV